ncbi:hypothetical protein PENSPDRAFT_648906 [Peniophora sp. CONT]|nr:hypothetical protein PENSPDRAFT_648906 [Peniophora sp. CONT]
MRLLPLTLLLALDLVSAARPHKRVDSHDYYVLEHDPRHGGSLEEVARSLGVEVVERAGELRDTYLVRADKTARHSESLRRRDATSHHPAVRYLARQEPRQRVKRAPPPIRPDTPIDQKSADVASQLDIHDPIFGKQWHLVNDEFPEHMMNVSRLWEMGITGESVISALVDDGLDYTSADLKDNFYAPGSYDYNDHEDLPTPKLFDDTHGTRCAGQIGAGRNEACGLGIAYNSKIAGIRILSGPISDIDEAAALNHNYKETSIYSCSWGPPDDGKSMEAPSYLIERAMINGIQNGREGKGSVFVFASGNGAGFGDQCNFDGYTNSIYSVTVAAVDYKGLHPYYSESCAANMVVAYSSGSGNHIVTTDKGENKCTESHGGTSAAAPNAVGVYALALGVRPDLTWRDIQHLTVRTAEVINPEDPDWEKTASGRMFSYKYGYGRLNGYALVTAAQDWQLVKPQTWVEMPAVQISEGTCDIVGNMQGGQVIVAGGLQHSVTVTQQDLDGRGLEKLEHITVRVWITHPNRGSVEVEVISPNGVKSILAASRRSDKAESGYPGWRFMSVKHWDENPVGDWTIRVGDTAAEAAEGRFLGWQLSLFGSSADATKTQEEYELSLFPTLLPQVKPSPTKPDDPTATKTHPKPTDHLPGDHGSAPGEADKPAFDNGSTTSDGGKGSGSEEDLEAKPTESASPTMTPTPDEGWFTGMGTLVSSQRWLFGAGALIVLFAICIGGFFLIRRRRRMHSSYSAVPDDALALGSMPGSGRPRGTKELYDAFGEASDDEDADERSRLRPAGSASHVGLGYHDSFLEDEEGSNAGTPGVRRSGTYRDEPELDEKDGGRSGEGHSPEGSGSGGSAESWEHASQSLK